MLSIGIMYENTIPFLITILKDQQFGLAQPLHNETCKSIYSGLHKIIKINSNYGVEVTNILWDGEFQTLDTNKIVAGVTLNIVTNNEHVPEVEWNINNIKEWTRSV